MEIFVVILWLVFELQRCSSSIKLELRTKNISEMNPYSQNGYEKISFVLHDVTSQHCVQLETYGYQYLNELQWFSLMISHQDSSLSNIHQGNMPYMNFVVLIKCVVLSCPAGDVPGSTEPLTLVTVGWTMSDNHVDVVIYFLPWLMGLKLWLNRLGFL